MKKFFRFTLVLVCLSPLVFIVARFNHKKIEQFSATGIVTNINWKSQNHGMPVISISDNGEVKHFRSNRITLSAEDIKEGDTFEKAKGSKQCIINEYIVTCIN